jgi:hypothetical protein
MGKYSDDNDTVCIEGDDEDPFAETPRYESMKHSISPEGSCAPNDLASSLSVAGIGKGTNDTLDDLHGNLFGLDCEPERQGTQGKAGWAVPNDMGDVPFSAHDRSRGTLQVHRCVSLVGLCQVAS